MDIDVIVPVRRGATIERLLTSFSRNTVWPHAVTLVTNELDGRSVECRGLNVRILRFQSDEYPIGDCDVALRRNVGIWASESSHVMTFDDDQIAPADLIQSTMRILGSEPYCWGHHRFIDFADYSVERIVALPPETGRTRETPPNAWHSWRSAYGGLFAADRTLLQQVGGFDMKFSGRHGGEDQDLGRRLAKFVHNSEAVYVHEPPFAWHPEKKITWDEPGFSNVCAEAHELVPGNIQGIRVRRCTRCPYFRVPDEVLMDAGASMPFDVSRLSLKLQNLGSSAPLTLNDVFTFVFENRVGAASDKFRDAYNDYVRLVSAPDMAISLRAAAFLWVLCEQQQPLSILDLGSGFSSFVFRTYAASAPATVWTVDDDSVWLERTRQFLAARYLDTNNLLLWEEFTGKSHGTFDLVCFDLGGMATRAQELRSVLKEVGQTAVLVLDDMHKEEYVPEVEQALRDGGWRYFDARSYTMDHFGRFCGVVIPTSHPLLR